MLYKDNRCPLIYEWRTALLKVAILGAGVSGLSAAIALENYGVVPDIYEQNSFIADHYSHVGVLFNISTFAGQKLKPSL